MRDRVLAYYFLLRKALRDRPDLRACLTRCRRCRIIFLTHRRNVRRKDLGCPFGCRAAHRKKQSAERSAAYYRTAAGKQKKARLNCRRHREGCDYTHAAETTTTEAESGEVDRGMRDAASSDPPQSECGPVSIEAPGVEAPDIKLPDVHLVNAPGASMEVTEIVDHSQFDTGMVEHVRLVIGLIERREVGREEILAMLAKGVRQHRIGRESHLDYVLAQLERHPP